MDKSIHQLISDSKNGNKESLLDLILRFKPLITKYKNKLHYEDAENDLTEHFIKTIKQIPVMMENKQIKYIENSIKNKYISLSKERQRNNQTIVSTETIERVEDHSPYIALSLRNTLKELSYKERKILVYFYLYGYSDVEISKEMKVSRQAVHKARKKALAHLGELLEIAGAKKIKKFKN